MAFLTTEGPANNCTVFDDLELAFFIVEYLASPDEDAAHLSEVFTILEFAVVGPRYHSC